MAAGIYNPTIEQGADFILPLQWIDGDDEDDDPIDLTDYTARMQIKDKAPGVAYADADAWVELTTENDGILLGTTEGTILLMLDAEATGALEKPIYQLFYDLELVDPDGIVTRLLEGKVTFNLEVTIT